MPSSFTADHFVLDGSVTLAWLYHDEKDAYADAIVARLPNLEMLVPRLCQLEVANVLLVGERRRRCSQAGTTIWLSFLSCIQIVVDSATEARAWSDTISLARQRAQSEYDAANLELAVRGASRLRPSTRGSRRPPPQLGSRPISRDLGSPCSNSESRLGLSRD